MTFRINPELELIQDFNDQQITAFFQGWCAGRDNTLMDDPVEIALALNESKNDIAEYKAAKAAAI